MIASRRKPSPTRPSSETQVSRAVGAAVRRASRASAVTYSGVDAGRPVEGRARPRCRTSAELAGRGSPPAARAPACPSQSGIAAPGFGSSSSVGDLGDPLRAARRARVFVPSSTVTGRSVESRSVKQRTPSADVSSCTPPESVSTKRGLGLEAEEREVAERLGQWITPASSDAGRARAPRCARSVRGWTGKTTGQLAGELDRAPRPSRAAAPGRRRAPGGAA